MRGATAMRGARLAPGRGDDPDSGMAPAAGALRALAEARFARTHRATERFFAERADAVSRACRDMARRFGCGGRLLAWGAGASASDAWHVAVEFVHPVLVGKRALPALVLDGDPQRRLELLAGSDDILMTIAAAAPEGDRRAADLARTAHNRGLLTVALAGRGVAEIGAAAPDHLFAVEEDDPTVVQEVHETLYHLLWELVHVFFEHGDLLGSAGERGDLPDGGDGLADLYPFLQAPHTRPADPAPVLADVRASTLRKSGDVTALRRSLWDRHGGDLVAAAEVVAASFSSGGKLLAFGNGGSATDSQDLVADLSDPPLPGWRALPTLDLTRDAGVVTAVANDVRFEDVFSRQVIAFGRPGDVAVGFSTSGESRNVVAALEQARSQGLRTIGFAGYEGGRMAAPGFLDAVVVAPSEHIPRIQEAHATAYHAMILLVQEILRQEAAPGPLP